MRQCQTTDDYGKVGLGDEGKVSNTGGARKLVLFVRDGRRPSRGVMGKKKCHEKQT